MSYLDRLNQFWKQSGMTQKELGDRVGLAKNTVSRILSGTQEPKLNEAFQIARELGVTLNDLVEEGATPDTPGGRLIRVSQDDVCLLRVAHALGVETALARLVQAQPTPPVPPTNPVNAR